MTAALDLLQEGAAVGIVDDVPADLYETRLTVQDAGFQPVDVPILDTQVTDVIAFVERRALQGVVCDHRLSQRAPSAFDGATLAASLYRVHVPAVLRTTFKLAGDDLSIRRHRRWLPRVLSRGSGGDEVAAALAYCADELAGRPERARVGQRTLVEIVDATDDGFDVVVPAWHPRDAVRLPLDLPGLPSRDRPKDIVGMLFFSTVNVWATEADELFFEGVEVAEPADDDFMR